MKKMNNKFKLRLKQLREEKNLSQTALAENLNVSRGSISYYENGDRIPDIETAKKIAKYFGVTTDYLIGMSDRIYNSDQKAYAKLYEEFEAYKKKVHEAVEKATIYINDLNGLKK